MIPEPFHLNMVFPLRSRWESLNNAANDDGDIEALVSLAESTQAAMDSLEGFCLEVVLILDKKLIFRAEAIERSVWIGGIGGGRLQTAESLVTW